jgi:hypothetical protein
VCGISHDLSSFKDAIDGDGDQNQFARTKLVGSSAKLADSRSSPPVIALLRCYPASMSLVPTPFESNDYVQLLDTLKERIRSSRLKAALAVNEELILLY